MAAFHDAAYTPRQRPSSRHPRHAGGGDGGGLAARGDRIAPRARGVEPDLRGGRSRDGRSGYRYLVPCRPGESGLAGRLLVNAGWSAMPEGERRFTVEGAVAGTIGSVPDEGPVVLTAAEPVPPLAASAPANIAEVPNNHLAYAFQWFFFAAAAAAIYALALRRRLSRAP